MKVPRVVRFKLLPISPFVFLTTSDASGDAGSSFIPAEPSLDDRAASSAAQQFAYFTLVWSRLDSFGCQLRRCRKLLQWEIKIPVCSPGIMLKRRLFFNVFSCLGTSGYKSCTSLFPLKVELAVSV